MKKQINFLIILSFLSTVFIQTVFPTNSFSIEDYDLVINNGNIFNPSTNTELEGYNIGIVGDKIKRITKEDLEGKRIIDATGKVVSPGFVDLISYDPNPYGIEFKVIEGVTSNLAMHGGTEDAKAWYDSWENKNVMTNFGASSFITRMRWPIVGGGVDAEITKQEDIDSLVYATRKNIEDGALGISFSLEYVPGIKDEIVPLLKLANEYNAPTFYHLRYSDKDNGPKGVEEVIKYAKETGASIHIMHINSTGGTFNMKKALNLMDKGIDDGLDITACIYPYDYWATYIDSARFREGWQDRYNIGYNDLQIGGTDIRISKDTFDKYRQERLLVTAHNSIPEEDNVLAIKHPNIMIGSDTIIEDGGNNHPRGSGTYGRLFNKYVNTDKVLTTMEAISKASYLPAKRMEDIAPQMKYKGRLEVESDADIVIFDLENFKDNSTVKDTELPSSGVEYVIINGQIVKDLDGLKREITPGRPIKSKFIDKYEERDKKSLELRYNKKKKRFDNIYNINNNDYISIKELFDFLELNYKINENGSIDINNLIKFNLGDKNFSIKDTSRKMDLEPIIYEGDLYLPIKSIDDLLGDYYDIDIKDNIVFNLNDKSQNLENREVVKEKDKSINNKNIKYKSIIFLLISVVLIIYILKQKKGRR